MEHLTVRSGSNIAIVAIVAFVIVILAFFFTAPTRMQQPAIIGVPDGKQEASRSQFNYSVGTSDRLDNATRREDRKPIVVSQD